MEGGRLSAGATAAIEDRVLTQVEDCADELVELAAALVQIPSVNPPGEHYRDCAELLGGVLDGQGYEVDYPVAEDRPEHTAEHPRVNVVGLARGRAERPLVHLNGHYDVVPAGEGWTVDPFGGEVRDGRLYGRGSADMKAGLASAVFAAEAIRRAGVELSGSVEISGTVDEESGGFAGVAHLAEIGRVSADRTDHVIIPEPLNVDRICVGHRGVYWFKVASHGRIGHGSMPDLGVNAITHMAPLLVRVSDELAPEIAGRTTRMPVVPPAARHGSINLNSIVGGQGGQWPQTPCVADYCEAIFDRRFLVEEGFEATRDEIARLVEETAAAAPERSYEIEDLMVVHPTQTPAGSPLVAALESAIEQVLGRPSEQIASPGTYDQKHFAHIGGVHDCVAYGPGVLEQAHQPDEWCGVQDMVDAAKVMALAILRLAG